MRESCAPDIRNARPTSAPPEPKTAGAIRGPDPSVSAPPPNSVVGHGLRDSHTESADDTNTGGGQTRGVNHHPPAAPGTLSLRIFAEVFDDLQKTRIATENRSKRGGVDPVFLEATLERLREAENEARLVMVRCYREVCPSNVRHWQQKTLGVGEHLLARLLGSIGHPVQTMVYEWEGNGSDRQLVEVGAMDRTVSQLWSYCGHGDSARKREKGMTSRDAAAMGNPRAKMLAHLLAESCIKQRRSPYRSVYDEARMDYESRDWTDLHRHNAALRKVAKAILKDLWVVTNA